MFKAQATNARQGLAALLVSSTGDMAAGLALGFMTGTLERLPGLIVLVPAAIGMRGNIFGALGSRLGTATHTGEYDGRLKLKLRSVGGQNVLASALLTLYISIALAVLARETARLFHVTTIPMLDYLTVSVVGGLISSLFVLGITVAVASVSVRRGWDMDNVSSPIVTAAGDLVTLPALWLATFLLPIPHFSETVGAGSLVAVVLATLYIFRHQEMRLLHKIVKQSFFILVIAGLVDVVAGLTIGQRLEQFLVFPGILVLIPPFLEDAGALGGILSARLASKLHLGSIEPRTVPGRGSWEDIALTYMLAVPVFGLVGLTGTLVSHAVGLATPGLGLMVGLTLIAGAIATTGAVFVAYYSAVTSFRFGLDPDNFGIPLVTSSMDLVGALALIATMVILGIAK
ncbi:MAG: magnesium transporter [Actinomycetota bacterium]